MKSFEIITHGGNLSPKTAAVRLPSVQPESMALWSLVIDNNNPNGRVRAIATLHWLLSVKDYEKFLQESFTEAQITLTPSGGTRLSRRAVPFINVGAYIEMLENTSFLKNTSLVKKLVKLTSIR
ncbi:MAG: hypothetical protein KC505_08080 [Myxococcales bacterium]|nr:hypothetical protein [Myxococcales bacterium]USN51424.1 MAG: hypothetical protein H6731_03180 [Myxococcales bacterium]